MDNKLTIFNIYFSIVIDGEVIEYGKISDNLCGYSPHNRIALMFNVNPEYVKIHGMVNELASNDIVDTELYSIIAKSLVVNKE